MSFQWIIDNAETISINRKKIVASTVTRDGTTRAVSRGGQVWKFDIKLPDGMRWTDMRQYISQAESLDRVSTATIAASRTGQEWIWKYQGDSVNSVSFYAGWTQGSTTLTLSNSASTPTGGYKFRAGDLIQLGSSGKVYTVTADVAYNSNSITLHRPIIENTNATVQLLVGKDVSWTVLCTNFPEWTLFARDQVSWSGSFTFVENLV
jgi:hypothetical protein